jgi:hypothetical protein
MSDDLYQRFAALFRGLSRAYGIYKPDKRATGNKVEGKAATVREPVTPALWSKHLSGAQGIGIVPITDEGISYFGAIDIDVYDIDIKKVEAQCATLNLPLLPTRTKSGGVHLYLFTTPEGVLAQLLRSRLEEWSSVLGYGGCEIFPKQDRLMSDVDVGNWINMPYYIADKTDRYGIFSGEPLTLADYVERAEKLRVTEAQLQSIVIEQPDEFADGPPCLQTLGRRGFGEGQRNKGLFAVGVYLKKRYPDDWAAHLHSYNTKFMRPPLPEAETRTLLKSLGRKDYNYACSQDPIKSFCNRKLCRKRKFGVADVVNEDWGIVIDNDVNRVETVPPHWVITVNGVRMIVFSEDLMQQRKFMELCMQRVGYCPPPLPGDKWRAEVNRLLQNAVSVEAPPDSSVHGELKWLLQQFCTVYPQGETREELLTGKPFTEKSWTYFRAADFKRFLESQHFRALNGHKLYAELRGMGVEPRQFWAGNQNVLVWCVPEFASSNEETVVPTHAVEKGGM